NGPGGQRFENGVGASDVLFVIGRDEQPPESARRHEREQRMLHLIGALPSDFERGVERELADGPVCCLNEEFESIGRHEFIPSWIANSLAFQAQMLAFRALGACCFAALQWKEEKAFHSNCST